MASAPCLLTAADSTSTSSLISYKPYLDSATDPNDNELVKPRVTTFKKHILEDQQKGGETRSKVEEDSKTNFLSMRHAYLSHSIETITQEERNTTTQKYDDPLTPSFRHRMFSIPPSLENRLEVMQRMSALVSEQQFYDSNPRRFESMPDYTSLYSRNRFPTSKFEDSNRLQRHGNLDLSSLQGCTANGCHCSEKDIFHLLHPQKQPQKKYTPLLEHSNSNYLDKTVPAKLKSESIWLGNRYTRIDEKHPYLRPEHPTSPLGKDYVMRSPKDTYGLLKRGNILPDDKTSSAFSIIRPSPIHISYPNDPSYLKDLTLSHSKFRFPSHSDAQISHRPYQEQRSSQSDLNIRQDKTLHVYDEASKAALKAFDAHIEQMIIEQRERKSFSSNSHELEIRHEEIQSTLNREKRFITSSNIPSQALQVSTIDSTQSSDSLNSVGGLLGLTMIANEHLGQAIAKEKRRTKNNNCLHLWQFLRSMLDQEKDKPNKCIEWTNRERGEFRLIKTAVIADLWGQSKNRTCMTYEKMARAMRYYYKMKILEKVPHKRLHFRFGEKMLAKVLDMNTIKPINHNNETTTRITDEPTRGFNTSQILHHSYSNGTAVLSQLLPTERSNTLQVKSTSHTTRVIRSTEEFCGKNDQKNYSLTKTNTRLPSSDSDAGASSFSSDETPVSSPISDSEGELIVDADVD